MIYLTRPGDLYQPPTGSFLGDLTNELAEYDMFTSGESYITEMASTGPKSYGYIVYTPSTNTYHYSVKIKGFSLNYKVQYIFYNMVYLYTMYNLVCLWFIY